MRTTKPASLAAVLAGLVLIAGCDAPRNDVDAVFGPRLALCDRKPDHPNCGGGGDGGSDGGLGVAFLGNITLFPSAPTGDYMAPAQSVQGNNARQRLTVNESPYQMTLDLAAELAAGMCGSPAPAEFTELGLADGAVALQGTVEITVNKKFLRNNAPDAPSGIVVNFTVSRDGDEYFITSGGGLNRMSADESSNFAKTGGFLRINKNGEIGPVCNDIVDYEFAVDG